MSFAVSEFAAIISVRLKEASSLALAMMDRTCRILTFCLKFTILTSPSCDVNEHLCGKSCARKDRKGCQGGCTQV